MQLYLIRHAQSTNNATMDQPGTRVADPPLTELGHQQAEMLAEHFKHDLEVDQISDEMAWRDGNFEEYHFHFDRIICSAMHRSLQTAKPLGELMETPVLIWPDVHERGGLFMAQESGRPIGKPGFTRERIMQDFPGFEIPDEITSKGWYTHDSIEPRNTSLQRALDVAKRLQDLARADWTKDNVAVISHGGFLDALMKAMLGDLSQATDDDRYFFYNTSVTRLDFWGGSRMMIRYQNRVEHLPPEFIS